MDCIRLDRQGIKYRVKYPFPTVADLELEVTQEAAGRLPEYKGLAVSPDSAATCGFVDESSAAPVAGDTLKPAYYHLRCEHSKIQANTSVHCSPRCI